MASQGEHFNFDKQQIVNLAVFLKVVDKIVCAICQEVADNHGSCEWVFIMIELLSRIESILWPLLVRLWELLTKQVCRLQPYIIIIINTLFVLL